MKRIARNRFRNSRRRRRRLPLPPPLPPPQLSQVLPPLRRYKVVVADAWATLATRATPSRIPERFSPLAGATDGNVATDCGGARLRNDIAGARDISFHILVLLASFSGACVLIRLRVCLTHPRAQCSPPVSMH